MKILSTILFSACTSLSLLVAAAAENPAADLAQKPNVSPSEPGIIGARVQTSGKIISSHSVNLSGLPDPHILVKLKGEDGEVDIVDLGLATELKSSGLEASEGKMLWVDGRIGKINDKELIMAENISETKLVSVVRKSSLREESVKHADARTNKADAPATATGTDEKPARKEVVDSGMQVRTIEGVVMHSRNMKIEGEAEEHVLVKVQTEQGIVVLDLGNVSTLPKVEIAEGKAIAATGYVGTINGKPLIVADSVGNLSEIQRK